MIHTVSKNICLGAILLTSLLAGCNSGSGSSGKGSEVSVSSRGSVEVDTQEGPVEGIKSGGMVQFKGIPYASAPVGELRFAPPQPAPIRNEKLVANEFGSACPQVASSFGDASTNEDCLFLNVYTPDTKGQYPVMVWIHGGAFVYGSGGSGYYPGRLVDKDITVVTLNYRLGALGFFSHPSLTTEMGEGSGNFGLMDQQLALQWVQNNIANFGGDPDNVTIFGESAGGHSVLSHLVSPRSLGLFDKVIVQSGSYSPDQMPLPIAEALGGAYVANAGCDIPGNELSCLRDLSVESILAAQTSDQYVPTTGTGFLPQSIRSKIASGDFSRVPVMEGTNLDEGSLFVVLQEQATGVSLTTDVAYRASVAAVLGNDPRRLDTDAIATRYLNLQNAADANRFSLAFSRIQTDWLFACDGLNQVSDLSEYVETYVYHFTDRNAPTVFPSSSFPLGATHAAEIPYVMNAEETMTSRGAGLEQIALSNQMLTYWSEFAKNGDPNKGFGSTDVDWPEFGRAGNMIMELGTPTVSTKPASAFDANHSCSAFWNNPPVL